MVYEYKWMKQSLSLRCLNPCSNGRWSMREWAVPRRRHDRQVLILVLMADGLWGEHDYTRWWVRVLILVLMADGLWDAGFDAGDWGRIVLILVLMADGLWDKTRCEAHHRSQVLILVLMADGLWDAARCHALAFVPVLILVLMADGLWGVWKPSTKTVNASLNPCSNGRWSMSFNLCPKGQGVLS